jgi:hypothetical protein
LKDATASGNFDKYFKCLRDPKNGPVLVGDWWLQRDVNNGQIYFKEGAVCAQISASAMDSKTTLELWDEKYINMSLGLFQEFKVDYDVSPRLAPTLGTSIFTCAVLQVTPTTMIAGLTSLFPI